MLNHIPVAEYTYGCYRYNSGKPYKTVDVKADSKRQASMMAYLLLEPTTVEQIIWMETRPNPDHVAYRPYTVCVDKI